jgi:hypothetical protein
MNAGQSASGPSSYSPQSGDNASPYSRAGSGQNSSAAASPSGAGAASGLASADPSSGKETGKDTGPCRPRRLRGPYAAEVDDIVKEINRQGVKWCADHTSMMHLAPQERSRRMGLQPGLSAAASGSAGGIKVYKGAQEADAPSPAVLDWRNHDGVNAVSPVKDQGCGDCWAFSATAALESQIMLGRAHGGGVSKSLGRAGSAFAKASDWLKSKAGAGAASQEPASPSPAVPDQSEQVLLSCMGLLQPLNNCNGGHPMDAAFFLQNIGLPPQSYFSYKGSDVSCSNAQTGWAKAATRTGGWFAVMPTVADIKKALAAFGPLVVTMKVYGDFDAYSTGVYSYTTGSYLGGHAVELIGYNDNDQAFIVKNSWGTNWGEGGFFEIAYSEVGGTTQFGAETLAYTLNPDSALLGWLGTIGDGITQVGSDIQTGLVQAGSAIVNGCGQLESWLGGLL